MNQHNANDRRYYRVLADLVRHHGSHPNVPFRRCERSVAALERAGYVRDGKPTPKGVAAAAGWSHYATEHNLIPPSEDC